MLICDPDEESEVETNSNGDEAELNEDDGGNTSNESIVSPTQQRRERRAPSYLNDYTSGEGLSDEEVQNFALFSSTNDPLFCHQAVK